MRLLAWFNIYIYTLYIYIYIQCTSTATATSAFIKYSTSVWRSFQERRAHDADGKRGQGPVPDCWKEVLARRRTGREGIDRIDRIGLSGVLQSPETVHRMYVDVGFYAYLGGVQYLGIILYLYMFEAPKVCIRLERG